MSATASMAGMPFRSGRGDAEGEEMALGGGDFLAGDDEQAVDGQAFLVHEAVLEKVIDAGAGVMVGDGEAAQALGAGLLDESLGLGHAVGGKSGEWQWRSRRSCMGTN